MNPNRSVASHATTSERLAALQVADAVLRQGWPRLQAHCRVCIGPNTLDAVAAFHYPGFVRVTLRYTGEPVAQSVPGRPVDLDAAAMAHLGEAWALGPA